MATADALVAGPAGRRFVRGGALRVLAYVGAITTSVFVMPFVTRHLQRADYGRYVTVSSLILIVAALTEGGLANLGVREFSGAPSHERREFMRNLIALRVCLSMLGATVAVAFALIVGYETVLVEGTALAGLGLLLANLQVTLAVPLTASLRLPWLAALDFMVPAITSLGLILLVVLDAPFLLYFATSVVAYAIGLAVTVALVRGQFSFLPSFDPLRWRALLRDSVVFAAATAFASIYFQVVVVAMSVIASATATGVFSLAFRILSVVNGVPFLLMSSAFPILLRAAQEDSARLRYALGRLLEGNLLLGGWMGMVTMAGAPFAAQVLGGSDYPGAATVLRILGAGVIATFMAATFGMGLLALRAYRTLIAIAGTMVLASIVLCSILIPDDGAKGAAIVTLILEVAVATAYATALFAHNRDLRPGLRLTARIAFCLALAYAAALTAPVSPLLSAVIGTVVLVATVLALRALPLGLPEALRGGPG